MTKRPDMQVLGAKLYHLRREKGLCAAAFAREIEQPAWLIMLLESAHMEQSKQLLDQLPDSVIEELLQAIREIYGVGDYWLTTRYQSPKHPPQEADGPAPEPLYLPVLITPEDAMTFLDDLMSLAFPTPRDLLQNTRYFRTRINGLSMLFQLHMTQLKTHGHTDLADQHYRQFRELLDQRMADWMRQLGIDDLDEDTPTPTA